MLKNFFITAVFLLLAIVFFNIPALEATRFEKGGQVKVAGLSASIKTTAVTKQ